MERMTLADGLTGISNRRHFDIAAERLWATSLESGTPMSVLLMDIDFFKLYNDTYGHLQGDECLKEVARTLLASANSDCELIARYGGEEFAVLMSGNQKEAGRVADLLTTRIRELNLPHKNVKQGIVTINCGTSTCSHGEYASLLALIRAADEALYTAKKQGRNRYVQAEMVEGVEGTGPVDKLE
ncbi:GGDEF domain-containing protein [Paenibacillus mucilaginosus]|nr:GGDEF domain-containing protein [Paenibacillus mucilaginosus]